MGLVTSKKVAGVMLLFKIEVGSEISCDLKRAVVEWRLAAERGVGWWRK